MLMFVRGPVFFETQCRCKTVEMEIRKISEGHHNNRMCAWCVCVCIVFGCNFGLRIGLMLDGNGNDGNGGDVLMNFH